MFGWDYLLIVNTDDFAIIDYFERSWFGFDNFNVKLGLGVNAYGGGVVKGNINSVLGYYIFYIDRLEF